MIGIVTDTATKETTVLSMKHLKYRIGILWTKNQEKLL